MTKLTKNQIRKFANERNCIASYSGKLKKFYFKRLNYLGSINVHALINAK